MSDNLELRRRFYAEELQVVCNLRSPRLVDAFVTVHREDYLRPGPWLIKGPDGDLSAAPHATPDADPRHVYHNVPIAIDPARQLFNGQPGTIAVWIDALDLQPGARVLHVGCGLGYFTAVIAHCVGPQGRVLALEVDRTLAAEAGRHLSHLPCVEVREGDAGGAFDEQFDAILINAGATHALDTWLDALRPGARMVLPLTFTADPSSRIGKGIVALLTAPANGADFEARLVGMVAIYSAVGLRSPSANDRLRAAFTRGWPALKRLRRDEHEPTPACWLHGDGFCLTA